MNLEEAIDICVYIFLLMKMNGVAQQFFPASHVRLFKVTMMA